MKNILKNIIDEFYKYPLPDLFNRSLKIPELPKGLRKAFVFIGMRRSGKTYLIYQHMKNCIASGLDKRKLLYINFEDDRLESFSSKDFQTILDIYFEMYPFYEKAEDLIFYFDEIQNIEGWEKFIRRLIDKEKMKIFITGSSSKSLSKEIATSLRGRCLTNEVFPLSFSEYLNYHKISDFQHITSKKQSIIQHHCKNYLKLGGFPETLNLSNGLHHKIIQSYVDTAVFRDIIDRYKLKNPHIVKLFLIYCLQNIASSLSVTKIYKTLKSRGESVGRNLLYDYLSYFEDAYLICKVPVFDFSTRKRQVNPNKIYCIDPGIVNAYSIKPHTEYSSCLETAVYIQLRRMNFENIYYYKTKSGKEIDFIAQQKNGQIYLYQVCIDLSDKKTKQREISAIMETAAELKIKNTFIITSDFSENLNFKDISINILPYWKWILNIES